MYKFSRIKSFLFSVRNKYMFAFQIKTVIAYNHIKRLKKEITHFFTNILELEPITSKY
jgi:hypothetical protein